MRSSRHSRGFFKALCVPAESVYISSFIYDILDYSGEEPIGFLEYISLMLPLALRILRRWLKTFYWVEILATNNEHLYLMEGIQVYFSL